MKNKIRIGIIIILVVIAAAIWYFAVFSMKAETTQSKSGTLSQQEKPASDSRYAALQGDAFDEAYIADMLAHHEGAVNMAEQAQASTEREEIRTLAVGIMQTQSEEMMQMRTWQEAWGYKVTASGGHNSHGGGGADMSGDMVEMQNKLQGLSDEAYDREFLKQMIIHHEQAVEMSQYTETNARHQELKDLAKNVISAQAKEIEQMKGWRREWGY